jgi:DNA repair protein RadA/Sms
MSRGSQSYRCQECGQLYPKWEGKCYLCNSWNSIEVEEDSLSLEGDKTREVEMISLANSSRVEIAEMRVETGISELNRVLGGGLMAGSVILLAGDPGVGKSTLACQVSSNLSKAKVRVLYVSGEETKDQVIARFRRIDTDADVALLCTQNLQRVVDEIDRDDAGYNFVVVDSLQALYDPKSTLSAYSSNQLRTNASVLSAVAKRRGTTLMLLGQITKDGSVSGPKSIEHLVDVVAYFIRPRDDSVRSLEIVKNRFGRTPEFADFILEEKGLTTSGEDTLMSKGDLSDVAGRAFVPVSYGSRYYLAEIQALVSPARDSAPRIYSEGLDIGRLQMLLLILDKELGLSLTSKIVLVQVVGSREVKDHTSDLAVAAALVSAATGRPVAEGLCCFGELSLLGELRPTGDSAERLRFAKSRGFSDAVCNMVNNSDIVDSCRTLPQALVRLGLLKAELRAIG